MPCMVYIRMGVGGGKTIVKAQGVALWSEQSKPHWAPCTLAAQELGVAAEGEQLHAGDENIILARQMEHV